MKRAFRTTAASVLVLGPLVWLSWFLLDREPRRQPETAASNAEVSVPAGDSTIPAPSEAETSTRGARPTREEEHRPAQSLSTPVEIAEQHAAGSIVGRVVRSGGGPIGSAAVELVRPTRVSTGLVMSTDERGGFRFPQVAPGDAYVVVARHPEFGVGESAPVVVSAAGEARVGDICVQEAASVQGIVTSGGRPVPDATITLASVADRLRRFERGSEPQSGVEPRELTTRTNAVGRYVFRQVPFSRFEVTAAAEGLARLTRIPTPDAGAARAFDIDFELRPGLAIRGRVVDESKRGIAGARVAAAADWPESRSGAEAVADAAGGFVLDQLAGGEYSLTADCDGYSPANDARVVAGASDVEIELRVRGSVAGVVVDEESGAPVPDFELSVALAPGKDGPDSVPVPGRQRLRFHDASGRFEVRDLDPGEYALQARASGYARSASDRFEVARGAQTAVVRIAMTRGGGVAGVVVDRSGRPVENAGVTLRENRRREPPVAGLGSVLAGGDPEPKAVTDERGCFRIETIVPGVYQLAIRHPAFAALEVNDVRIEKGAANTIGSIELAQGGRVIGRVRDLDGDPLPGATVVAYTAGGASWKTLANGDGCYELTSLASGEYTVAIGDWRPEPPMNPLQALGLARNSARLVRVDDGGERVVDLQLSRTRPGQ